MGGKIGFREVGFFFVFLFLIKYMMFLFGWLNFFFSDWVVDALLYLFVFLCVLGRGALLDCGIVVGM